MPNILPSHPGVIVAHMTFAVALSHSLTIEKGPIIAYSANCLAYRYRAALIGLVAAQTTPAAALSHSPTTKRGPTTALTPLVASHTYIGPRILAPLSPI